MKINITVSRDILAQIDQMHDRIESALDRAIIHQSAENQAELYLMQLGFIEPSARAIVMAAWLKAARRREGDRQRMLEQFTAAHVLWHQNPALCKQMTDMDSLKAQFLAIGIPESTIDTLWQQIGYSAKMPKLPTMTSFAEHLEVMTALKDRVMMGDDLHAIVLQKYPAVFHPVTGQAWTIDEVEAWRIDG